MTAAQILRLVDDGEPAASTTERRTTSRRSWRHSTRTVQTIRDLLGMRSGLRHPDDYGSLVDRGLTTPDLMARVGSLCASRFHDRVLKHRPCSCSGRCIEQVSGRSLSQVRDFRRPCASGTGPAGARRRFGRHGRRRLADEGRTPRPSARWGYGLYGGSVVSDAAPCEINDFGGEWYGLGVIDFTHPDAGTFDTPVVGHGGSGVRRILSGWSPSSVPVSSSRSKPTPTTSGRSSTWWSSYARQCSPPRSHRRRRPRAPRCPSTIQPGLATQSL